MSLCILIDSPIEKGGFHTLFNEWTKMFFAPISFKSLSASYFKSFDTLNLSKKINKIKIDLHFFLQNQEQSHRHNINMNIHTLTHSLKLFLRCYIKRKPGLLSPHGGTYHSALFLLNKQFSYMIPAIVRPLPTPAPSPIKKPARSPLGRNVSCC